MSPLVGLCVFPGGERGGSSEDSASGTDLEDTLGPGDPPEVLGSLFMYWGSTGSAVLQP
jgi:hypothetical protein